MAMSAEQLKNWMAKQEALKNNGFVYYMNQENPEQKFASVNEFLGFHEAWQDNARGTYDFEETEDEDTELFNKIFDKLNTPEVQAKFAQDRKNAEYLKETEGTYFSGKYWGM